MSEQHYMDPEEGVIQDGLTLFVKQGKWALDASLDGLEYHLDIYGRKPECEDLDTFFNISYMNGEESLFEQFSHVRRETFKTRGELMGAIAHFVTSNNHF